MDWNLRRVNSRKQNKVTIKKGTPTLGELSEGVPVIRMTNEGLAQWVRYNNKLYRLLYTREDHPVGVEIIQSTS